MAGWTLRPEIIEKSHNYVRWVLHCTSDGSALTATDIFSETHMPRDMKTKLQGLSYMGMKIDPLTGTTTTINVTLSDTEGDSLFAETGASNSAISNHDLSTDISRYPTFFSKMYLTINDVGSSGEKIDLYFECWKEDA